MPSSRLWRLLLLRCCIFLSAVAAAEHETATNSSSKSGCPTFSRPAAPCTSVWSMRPSQVDVVLAVGDSITAAFGARGKRGGFHESRGLSWSIGGDEGALTLPNFIKEHNPNVTGYSLGSREASLCWGPVCRDVHRARHDRLNGALSGSMVRNVWFDQLDYLEAELLALNVDVEKTWKVLTLFVGANDLCLVCKMQKRFDPTEFAEYYRRVLIEIRNRFPRTLVNVVELFNVSAIYRATEDQPYCRGVHRLVFLECDCAFGPESEARPFRDMMDEMATAYNQQVRAVIRDLSQVRNETFAIALHPFTRDLNITSFPMEMISTLDCFHPSAKSHGLTATALWNSMLTPPEERPRNIPSLTLEPLCAGEDSVFYPGSPPDAEVVWKDGGAEGYVEGVVQAMKESKSLLRAG